MELSPYKSIAGFPKLDLDKFRLGRNDFLDATIPASNEWNEIGHQAEKQPSYGAAPKHTAVRACNAKPSYSHTFRTSELTPTDGPWSIECPSSRVNGYLFANFTPINHGFITEVERIKIKGSWF